MVAIAYRAFRTVSVAGALISINVTPVTSHGAC